MGLYLEGGRLLGKLVERGHGRLSDSEALQSLESAAQGTAHVGPLGGSRLIRSWCPVGEARAAQIDYGAQVGSTGGRRWAGIAFVERTATGVRGWGGAVGRAALP